MKETRLVQLLGKISMLTLLVQEGEEGVQWGEFPESLETIARDFEEKSRRWMFTRLRRKGWLFTIE